MPKLPRQVEQEVKIEELNDELAEYANSVRREGVFLPGVEPGQRGERVRAGQTYKVTPVVYQQGLVAEDTEVFVIETFDEAGVAWGAFFDPQGNKRHQFFTGDALVAPELGDQDEASPKRRGRVRH